MSSIQINRGTKAEIDNTPVTDGLICFQTDDNFIYMDNGDTREAFGGVKVIPNPQEEPTEVLRNLQIADDVYKISGGHEIEDQSGTTLTQRDKMRFTGAYSHDDSTNEVTKIDIVREMTVAQKDTLTGDEVEGFQWTTDENNDLPLTTDWVAYRDGQSATEALDDAIKEVLNDNGDTLTSRGKIQFVGTYTEDDSTDEVTKVDVVREFNSVANIEALTGEEAKGFQYLDDDVYDEFTAGDIGFDNSDTSFVGTNVQDVLEEVDDKIDGVLVKSIPANTYNTYALALAELETYFNVLTFSEKLRAKIVRNDSIVFSSQAIADKIFSMPNTAYSSGTKVLAQTIDLNNHTYVTATITSGSVSVNDVSSSAQALKLDLYVM